VNRRNWRHHLCRLQGSTVQVDLRGYDASIAAIAAQESATRRLSDQDILQQSHALQAATRAGQGRTAIRTRLFALAREAAHRVLGLRPFDEQLLAALALDDGRVVEMLTGEGKTLAAVMPAALNAAAGRGAHVLTFNDYLARRDAEWMGPIYRMLGLSVGHIGEGMTPRQRRAAYLADVTYVTAKEAGFDHLRDLIAMDPIDLVHRPFNFALVDEADSLMIDEARVPLVIAGHAGIATPAAQLTQLVSALSPGVHFDTDEYGRDVELTDAGIELVEQVLGCGSLHGAENARLLTELNCALHARILLRRDVDYLVRNDHIALIDEFTGRLVLDRRWPDGLQSALEAKEGLEQLPDGHILGSLTLQRFLRGYPRLCGMSGTAADAAAEFQQLYGLDVAIIPSHCPVVRVDHDDLVFTHREPKERAIVAEVARAHAAGRPVLVGTASVIESEGLAQRLRDAGVACRVLNARNDDEEAAVVARAGELSAVTISTSMAGRGTDIRLGGEGQAERNRIAALGGLYVIGTNRHESHRVDLQLRGRAGRQGDPGETRFFTSLEDELLVRFGICGLIPVRWRPERSDQPIANPVVRREAARAQRIIEGQNLEIRRTLARYADVVEQQHFLLLERRQPMLTGEHAPDLWQRLPESRAALVASAGEPAVVAAERTVTLSCIDRAWRDHLAFCADLREGIHLVRLGGRDPLTHFTREVIDAFGRIDQSIDDAVLLALSSVKTADGRIDLTGAELQTPSATWTYLVNDDPFRNRIGAMLSGPGGATLAIYSAAITMPLLLLWGLIENLRRRIPRRPDPFG
jgi:preprotein translocase subunit SecA